MSGNSSSATIIPQPSKDTQQVKDSLFDELDQNLKLSFKIWSQSVPLIPKKTSQRSVEGILFRKSIKKGYWKSKRYELIGNKLIKMNNSESPRATAFACVENYRLEKIRMEEKGDKDVKYGFRLSHNGQFIELFARTKDTMSIWFDALKKQCVLTTFSNDYSAIKLMGKGNFARVYYARSKLTGGEFAVKAFEKEKFAQIEVDRPALIKEISILRKLNHPGVIKMHEVYENDTHVFLINELLKGGELFHKLKGHGQFDEEYVASLMSTLLDSIKYIANRNILHRDIKPENLILRSKNDDTDLCLADFGLADYYDPKGGYMFQRCGTPGYVAPEVLADKIYDFKVDSFSAGVIMFILLTGSSPFKGKSYDEIVIKNYNCTIDFNYKDMKTFLSAECYDLLLKLLKKEPTERYSAAEALAHPWFAKMKQLQAQKQLSSGSIENEKVSAVSLPKQIRQASTPANSNSVSTNGETFSSNIRSSFTQLDNAYGNNNYNSNKKSSQTNLDDNNSTTINLNNQLVRGPKEHLQLKCKTPLMNSKWEAPAEYQSPDTWKRQQQQQSQLGTMGGFSRGVDSFDSPLHRGGESPNAKTPGGNQYSQPYNRKTPDVSGKTMKMENTSIIKMQSVPELDEYDAAEIKKQRLAMVGDGRNNNIGINTGGINQRRFKESFQSPIIKNPSIAFQGNSQVGLSQNPNSISVNQSLNSSNVSENLKQTKSIREKLIQNV